MSLKNLISNRILIFDGAMGTMLQQAGLPTGGLPELYNLTHQDTVLDIHKSYVAAGADVVTTNTFGANSYKLAGCGHSTSEIVTAAVKLAKQSGARLVALDIGPLGQLLEPLGTLSFEDAYDMFAEQAIAGERAGADIVVIETMSDLLEAKAALLAVKENTKLPAVVSMSYQADGRTFVGCPPVSTTLTLCAMGADAVGVNCSLGPAELTSIVKEILRYASVPVIVQANAGIPRYENEQTIYPVKPAEYAAFAKEFARLGIGIIGGCCGTSPEYIHEVKKAIKDISYVQPGYELVTAAVSGTRAVVFDRRFTVIGERINPTGKKKLQQALREGRWDYVMGEAIDQAEAAADLLDVNVGLPELDEVALMRAVVRKLQSVTDLPLMIDSSDPAAIEAGARLVNGRSIINSVNGKEESMAAVLPIAKKYGALVVGLTLDENGIPPMAEGRLAIARRIVERAASHGIPACDILIDCLTLTASAQQEQIPETLRAITLIKRELGVKTVLGVSNVSFGLPAREMLNSAFLATAFGAGLDAAIINPLSERYQETVDSLRVLNGEDAGAEHYAHRYGKQQEAKPIPTDKSEQDLTQLILQGRKGDTAPRVRAMLADTPALEIVNRYFVPALNLVGERFERGEIFLPQLMQSADAVKNGFDVVRAHVEATGEKNGSNGKIVIATVEGDVHDIGKNIVRMILENYGYDVIDLGKDVSAEEVANAIEKHCAKLVGLSALMTTTVNNMKRTIEVCRGRGTDCRFMVGGAVLSEEYADYVGADFYAKDAMRAVEIANSVLRNGGQ